METEKLLLIGVVSGLISGLFGIGGGIIIVPALMLFLGLTQRDASSISIITVLGPVGIIGAYTYYSHGLINSSHVKSAITLGLGLLGGTAIGALIGVNLSGILVTRLFAVFMAAMAIKFWMGM